MQDVLKFLQEYQTQFNRTQAFGVKVKELGLLEGMQAQITLPSGDALAAAATDATASEPADAKRRRGSRSARDSAVTLYPSATLVGS